MFAFKHFLFENLLLEDKIAYILDKQGDKAWDAYEADKGQGKPKAKNSEEVIKTLSKWSDKNLQWLVNSYIKGQFSLEDKSRVNDALEKYNKFKSKLKIKDLNQYKSLHELETALSEFSEEDAKSKNQLNRERSEKFFKDKEAKVFFDEDGVRVIIPKTEEASCYFGIGTKWCTAAEHNNRFADYSKRGNLYIVFTKDGRKYQFFFRKGEQQFADEKDHMLNSEEFNALVKKFPALYDAFDGLAKKTGFLGLIKDPSEAEYLTAVKNDTGLALEDCIEKKRKLPKVAADYVIQLGGNHLKDYAEAFDKDHVFKQVTSIKSDKLIPFMIKSSVTKQEFLDIVEAKIKKRDYFFFDAILEDHFGHSQQYAYGMKGAIKTLREYSKWLKDLPLEKIEEIIKIREMLLNYFEDVLPEKTKIDMLNKDPGLLKYFKNPTPKMTQQARWAEDRIKREKRGF